MRTESSQYDAEWKDFQFFKFTPTALFFPFKVRA